MASVRDQKLVQSDMDRLQACRNFLYYLHPDGVVPPGAVYKKTRLFNYMDHWFLYSRAKNMKAYTSAEQRQCVGLASVEIPEVMPIIMCLLHDLVVSKKTSSCKSNTKRFSDVSECSRIYIHCPEVSVTSMG